MPFDINQLRTFEANNDRVGYYNYLGQYDAYGRLAVGVATNETTAGFVANRYFSGVYEEKVGVPPTADTLRQIGSDLMQRDLAARENDIRGSGTGLNLLPETIANYHGASFSAATDGLVGKEGWTAWAPLRDSIETNDSARANQIWSSMLQDNFWQNANLAANGVPASVFGASNPNMTAGEWAAWNSKVTPAWLQATGADADSISIRNSERINGWSHNGDGTWTREEPVYDSFGVFTGHTEIKNPNSSETAALNTERQARIDHYGSNVTQKADATDTLFEHNGDVTVIDKNGLGTTVAEYDGGTDDPTYEIKLSELDPNGELLKTEVLKDDHSREVTTHDPLDIRPEAYRTFAYDAAGRLDSDRIMNDNGTSSIAAYGDDGLLDSYLFYDAQARLDSYYVYNAEGKLDYNYFYDDANRPDTYYTYDSAGRVDSYWVYDDASRIIYNYTYDDQLVANSYREYNTSYELTREYVFDAAGEYDYSRTFYANGLMATLTEYDDAQRVDRHFVMDAQGKADYAYTYDDANVALTLVDYNASQGVDAYYVYNANGTYDYEFHYDAQGRETTFSDYGVSNTLESYIVFKPNGEYDYQYHYNAEGRIEEKIQFDPTGDIDYVQYFDAQLRVDVLQDYAGNVIVNQLSYTDAETVEQNIQFDAAGGIDTIRYYDNQQNLDVLQDYTNNVLVDQNFYNNAGAEITQSAFVGSGGSIDFGSNVPDISYAPVYDITPYVPTFDLEW